MGIDISRGKARIYCGVFFISLSVLALELVLTRIFSVTMYYHFAFMAISLALFGSGASGVVVYLKSARFTATTAPAHMAVSSILMALSIGFALFVLLRVSIGLVPSYRSYITLTGLYIVCAAPFFFAGICLSLAMKHFAQDSGRLYFFDLTGASAGCLLVIPALNLLGGPTAMLAVALLALVSAFSFSSLLPENRKVMAAVLVVTAIFSGVVVANARWNLFAVTRAKGSREKPTIFAKWNSFSRVTVTGDVNDVKPLWITIDSDAGTPILRFSNNPDAMKYVWRAVSALAYRIKNHPKVLVIGPGGGREVVTALESGSRDITGVEVNPIIVRDIMQVEPYRSFSGNLYSRPDVKVVVDEGRSYLRSRNDRFDVIQASLIDTWAANSAGAFALTENNLYTVEAFKLYLEHLNDDGLLTMTRWLLDPPQQELRLVSLAREVMRQTGITRPETHLCLFKAPGRGERIETCFIFKKSEFTNPEVRALEETAAANGFEVLYTPLTRPANVFADLATTTNPDAFYARYPIDVRPTFDNSPFFFYHVTPGGIWKAFRLTNESQKTNMGVFVLFSLLVITAVLVGLFMLGPLILARRRFIRTGSSESPEMFRRVIYFAFLGLGFIVIEMAMIQRFILFLGYPVYALAVVLFSLLFWSGVGSLMTSRVTDKRLGRAARLAMTGIIVTALVYIVLLPGLFDRFGGEQISWRIVMAAGLLIPLGAALGMPMPLGIRLLSHRAPALVPWAWGINGATSVMGSVIAVILAMNWGFSQALAAGSGAYACAILLAGSLIRGGIRESDRGEVIEESETVVATAGD